jgi:uncharacterized YccA/Bax inhibitor family protein
MRTNNPAFNDKVLAGLARPYTGAEVMTVNGTITKSVIMLFLIFLTAGWTWNMYFTSTDPARVVPWMIGGLIGGLVVALVTIFKKQWAPFTSPIYALLEGLFLGGVSAMLDARLPGIVIQAVGLTFGTLLIMLLAYRSGLINVTDKFRMGVVAATGGIALVYLATIGLGFFGVRVPFIHDSGLIGIGFSLFVVVIAALNLALDFDLIEKGAAGGAPKYVEWYAAFGLMVTLIWLYIEFLRLLSKLRSR